MRLRNTDKPFGLSFRGAILIFIALYAVGVCLAFLTDERIYLLPGHIFMLAYAAAWGLRQHRKLRGLTDRYESYLRRRNGQD